MSDYTRRLATGLAAAGEEVHVWAPAAASPPPRDPGVEVHPLSNGFGPRGLRALHHALARCPPPRRLLVQYVPQAFGYRAMNLPFCLWLAARPANEELWVMFHEVAFPWGWSRPLTHNVLGAVTRTMALALLSRADRALVSTASWEAMLRALPARLPPVTWLPIPSNLPVELSPTELEAARATLHSNAGGFLLGHFGTYGAPIADLLRPVALRLLAADHDRRLLLLGRRGEDFAASLAAADPSLTARLIAPGMLPEREVAARLAACDVLVQPFPDGVTTRRTSVMAGLALGVPTVTNEGPLTEPWWRETGPVELASAPAPDAIAAATERVLADGPRRTTLGARAKETYRRELSSSCTVEKLLALAAHPHS